MHRIIIPMLALVITAGSLSATAQTKSRSSSKAVTAQKSESARYRRLPPHWGKLDLDEDQRADVYDIREDYGIRIAKLKAEIEQLQEEMSEELDDVLTSSQKSALAKLKSSRTKTAKTSDEEDEEKPSKTNSRRSGSSSRRASSK